MYTVELMHLKNAKRALYKAIMEELLWHIVGWKSSGYEPNPCSGYQNPQWPGPHYLWPHCLQPSLQWSLMLPKPMSQANCCLRTFALAAPLPPTATSNALPQIFSWLTLSPPSSLCSDVSSSVRAGLISFLKNFNSPLNPPITLILFYFLPESSSPSSMLCRFLTISSILFFIVSLLSLEYNHDKGEDLCFARC